ncbi:tyrosine-type recombinase/integrase [Alcaligenes aquatilis]|uniref:DUF4102 domain-containing protein n=1 Tax=Alcaligenes aquatilis TaxID=323284 RepID=A0A3G2HYM0_9BURK|nr:integrase arm-type DNA-binding domain-containing protein [Alcaligenes aquatilis]AYN22246.1 DUF4102 domain-containing protein [Alcaligenes aquatilis]
MSKIQNQSHERLLTLSPQDKEYLVDCGEGLFLRVRPSGGKSWVRRYTKLDGKRSQLGLGTFPKVTLHQARDENIKASLLIECGKDPKVRHIEERVAQLKASLDTFEKVGREWHRHATLTHEWSPSYSAKILRMLELHAFPTLGKYPIALVHQSEVADVLSKVAMSGTRETAVRLREKLQLIWARAVTLGILAVGQNFMAKGVADFKLPRPRQRNFAALKDPVKVGQLMRDIEGYGGNYITRCAMQIMPYLFQRPGQIRFMEWDQIDLGSAIWTCPPTIMKRLHADKHDEYAEPHIVPMPLQVVDILRELRQLTGPSGPVFKSMSRRKRKDGTYSKFISDNTINAAIRTMGYCTRRDITGHGFRAMARTMLRERLGWDKEEIERHLDHVSDEELGDTYDRTEFVEQRRKMVQTWADYLDSLRDGPAPSSTGDNAVKLNRVA